MLSIFNVYRNFPLNQDYSQTNPRFFVSMNEYIFWIGFLKFSMKPYFPPCNERKSYWQENKYLTVNYLYKPQKRFNTLFEKFERARSLGGRQIQRRIWKCHIFLLKKKTLCTQGKYFLSSFPSKSIDWKKLNFLWKFPSFEKRTYQKLNTDISN